MQIIKKNSVVTREDTGFYRLYRGIFHRPVLKYMQVSTSYAPLQYRK